MALALVVLLVVGLGALYVFLPGLVDSPAVRARIEQAARDATGREFHYEALSFGLFPPRLVVESPTLAGESEGDPPFAEARDVSLRLAFLPLLSRAVVLENLVVNEATVRVVRDASGLRLPEPEAEALAEGAGAPRAPGGGEASDGVALAVEEFLLRDARVILEDRTVTPAATWDVDALDAKAAFALNRPVRIDADASVGGGTVKLGGTADLVAEKTDLEVGLDRVGLALLKPYLGDGQAISGSLSGTVRANGALAAPALDADLRVADGDVRVGGVGLRGPLAVKAELSGGDARSGTFDVDATEAALDAYDGAFQKPAGKPGALRGRFLPRPNGGITVDDLELKIHDLDARGRVEIEGEQVRGELTAAPFDLAGWDEILPALADYGLSGRLEPGTLRFVSEPLALHGRIGLAGVQMSLPDGARIGLDGAVEGTGDALALRDVALTTGGETVRVVGEVSGLAKPQRAYRLALDADGAESNTLLSAFTAMDDQLFGPLFLDTKLAGRTGDPSLESLTGRMSFAVRPGKLKDVSLLQQTVAHLGTFGEAALLMAALDKPDRMKKMERFYGDEFIELAGVFDVGGGWARTNDLRLVYDGYRVDLRGGLRLRDLRLDFTGTLTLDREVDQTLAEASGEGAAAEPEKRVIELAKVEGTVDDPKVRLSSGTVRHWVGSYGSSKLRRKYQEDLDEKLGKELGGEVGDLVEGIFGRKR